MVLRMVAGVAAALMLFLSNDARAQDNALPQVTTDGAGNWVEVWQSTNPLYPSIGTDYDILIARSTDGLTNWSFAAPLNTNAASDPGDDYSPQVTTDGAGNWVAVWSSKDSILGTHGYDADIMVACSRDAGATWSIPAFLNTNAASDGLDDWWPQVTTDGAGNWVAVWQSSDPLGGTIDTDYDILVARSTDAGATWTPPVPLNNNAATDTGLDEYPQVTTDGAGNWVAVWQSSDSLGGTTGTDYDILVARSTDAGATWTAPVPLNNNAVTDTGLDEYPQVTTDGAGSWVAVWQSSDSLGGTIGTDADIFVARSLDAGETWSAPMALNTNAAGDAGDDWIPQVTTDGAGNWLAIWYSFDSLGGTIGTDADILVARSLDAGITWSAPEAYNDNAATDSDLEWDWYPQVTTDGVGKWVVTWSTDIGFGSYDISFDSFTGPDADGDGLSDGAEVNLYGSDPHLVDTDGDGFSDETEVSAASDPADPGSTPLTVLRLGATAALNTNAASDTGADAYPQLATDGAGTWLAVWHSTDSLSGSIGTDFDILVARSTDAGASWSDPVALNDNAATDSGDDADPQLATDGAGTWLAVWHSSDSLGSSIGTDFDILVARSTDAGASWSTPLALNANAATDSGDDGYPQLATDGAGNWVAVWWSYDSLGGTIGTDADILVARSTNGGVSWSIPAPISSNAGTDSGEDYQPQVTVDSAGNWVAVWYSSDSLGGSIGTDYDILVARSTDAGATWSDAVALNANAATDSGTDADPQVTRDGAGNWVAVWYSSDSLGGTIGTDYDILVARSTDAGATWSDPVALNANAATDSETDANPQVTTDGAGNWVAAWRSRNSLDGAIGTDFDILVARSTDAGASWSAPKAINTNAATDSGDDGYPQVTTDGAGNWVAVWWSYDSMGGTIGTDADILEATGTGPDVDGDGLSDGAEVNLYGTDPLLADTDGDNWSDAIDCNPIDSQAWSVPGEVLNLFLVQTGGSGDSTTLNWTAPGDLGGVAVVYDMISSAVASDFTTGNCEESNDGLDTQGTNTTVLSPGQALYFLVRAGNACGEGSSGADSAMNQRNMVACP